MLKTKEILLFTKLTTEESALVSGGQIIQIYGVNHPIGVKEVDSQTGNIIFAMIERNTKSKPEIALNPWS